MLLFELHDMALLKIDNLTKDFPGVRALDSVRFSVEQGEIHCLCGENGAGKSTLMKIISGVYPFGTYEGTVTYKGDVKKYHDVKDSENDKIAIIHQELALSPFLSIAENIFLGHYPTKFGIINFDKLNIRAQGLLDRIGLEEDPQTIVRTLGVGKQQLIEIAKALSKEVELLILDEPTSSLNDEECEHLLNFILQLKEQGITCVMISHKLNEVLKIADSITILRDGKTITTLDNRKHTVKEGEIIKEMVGRDMTDRFPSRTPKIGDVQFEVKNWTVYHPTIPDKKVVTDASFNVRKGEIVGICGLMGSGRTELMMSIFGSAYGSRNEGDIYLHGKKVHWKTPKDAIEDGLGYISEDRKELGLILIQDVKSNIVNSSLRTVAKLGVVNNHQVEKIGIEYKDKMNIKTPTVHTIVSSLSGGNQQKVVISRCLYAMPDILIIDEPTRGIDVGAKYEIYAILNELVAMGKSIIMISSELVEVLGMSDRIFIMNEGKIKGELLVKDANQEKIMQIAIGEKSL